MYNLLLSDSGNIFLKAKKNSRTFQIPLNKCGATMIRVAQSVALCLILTI